MLAGIHSLQEQIIVTNTKKSAVKAGKRLQLLNERLPLCTGCSDRVRTDLHQVVVRTVEVFVQLDHQALKE